MPPCSADPSGSGVCRTPALGGHVTQCDHCGEVRYHYHSCGNRSCPQCGGSKRAAWLAKCQADLLPVPYFHVVFTLPHELRRWSWATASSCIGCSSTAQGDSSGGGGRPQAPGSADRGADGVAHVGAEAGTSSPRSLCRARRRVGGPRQVRGKHRGCPGRPGTALGVLPAQLVLVGQGAQPGVPRQVPGGLARGLPSWPTPVRREHLAPGEPGGLESWSGHCTRRTGWSTPRSRSAGRNRC